jgi:hypothetical protein
VSSGRSDTRSANARSNRSGQRQPAGDQLLVADHGRQLEDRQRIPGRLAEDACAHPRRKVRGRRVEQGRGRRVVEASDPAFRQPGIAKHRGVAVTRRRQQQDRVGLDPPRDERQHVRRRAVEPVGVLHQQQERSVGCDLREQIESRHRDPEVLRRGAVHESERGIEGVALNVGQFARTVTHRAHQLMQPGKRQVRLRLHTGRGEHRHAARARGSLGLRQQARFADAGLAAKHESVTPSDDLVQERFQEPLLSQATYERCGFVTPRPEHVH